MNGSRASKGAVTPSPLVSVLLPVGGRRATLRDALSSLLGQTLVDIEVLAIGHDDVVPVVAEVSDDARVRPIARRAPGIVGALNTGLALARGRYLARMDDDDVAHPSRLQVQLEHLREDPRRDLIGARVRLVDERGGPAGVGAGNRRYEAWLNALVSPGAIRDAAFVENPLPHPTWFAERVLFQRLGGWREGDFPEDHDLVLRAWLARMVMSKPEPVLLDWRDHPDRLTRTDRRYRREAFTRLKARIACDPASGLGLGPGPGPERGVWIAGVGRSARHWCDALVAEGAAVHGFVDLARPGARRRKRHRPVIDYAGLLERRGDDLVLGAVTQPAARAAVIDWCGAQGLVAGRDYLTGD